MKHLILGYGEVGKGLHKVLKDADVYDMSGVDTRESNSYEFVHICYPYHKNFKQEVRGLMWKYASVHCFPIVVVHSSVPVGTCDSIEAIHSPVRGVHPNIDKGIKTFVKYIGGLNIVKVRKVEKMLNELGIKTEVYRNAKTTEAIKLWDTTQYGRLIMLEKEIHQWCEKNKIDFNAVYTQANKDYNEGYTKLKRPEVVRPYLKHVPGPIGGHCVMPNAKLLKKKV